MTWECSSGAAANCATAEAGGPEPGDPPIRDLEGAPHCLACARELGLIEPTYQDPPPTDSFNISG